MRCSSTLFILLVAFGFKLQAQKTETLPTKDKILFIVSNAQYHGNSDIKTYNHFTEIVWPYDILVKAGYTIDFVSPKGGAVPIGYIDDTDQLMLDYLDDTDFMNRLKQTHKPSDITPSDYKAVYYGGGGAAMYGVPENKAIQSIVMDIYEKHQGIVSAVCHGAAGLVNLKTKDGQYLIANKVVNGYPDAFEDMKGDYYKHFPFSIEKLMIKHDGDFQYSKEGWDRFMVSDGRLITGQDPTAAGLVAEAIIRMLENKDKTD